MEQNISFFTAALVTMNINFFINSKYIFLSKPSAKSYIKFLGTSGYTRIFDYIMFTLLTFISSNIYKAIIATGFGTIIRFISYEYLVFDKKND